ncbi:MAG TPA: 50S ribosomal protein L25/general stress protein Ctc [Gammaproteobacteria bacterium]|nr:50S ribosomal protein L25/general stress protein Ctc [Gammaproteobacteria bacterium]
MNEFEVVAELRKEIGTRPSRRYRKQGKIPAVLYGADKEATPLLLDANQIGKQLSHEAFFSHILSVKVDGQESQAVLRSLQRDPASSKVTHVDFFRVSATEEIEMNVPLHFINEDKCPGKKAGGIVSHLMVDLEISCLPKDLPEYIEVDIINLDIGDSLHLSEIRLPPGVTLATEIEDAAHDHVIVSVSEAHELDLGEEPEEALEGEALEAAAEEGAEGEEKAETEEGEGEEREKDKVQGKDES